MNKGFQEALAEKRRIRQLELKQNKTEAEKKEIKLYCKKMLVGTGTNSDESLRDFHNLFPS